MTAEEKQAQIQHLSSKFYDINERPSCLLFNESQYAEVDEHIQNAIKKLEDMEVQRYTVDATCTAKLNEELRIWKRIFESQNKKLAEKHERQKLLPPFGRACGCWNPVELERVQQQEKDALKREHKKDLDKVKNNIMSRLTMYDNDIRSLYLDTVRYMYR